ncbi:MAG: hypothetical protein ACXV7J_06400 [Methylomonas sp.]
MTHATTGADSTTEKNKKANVRKPNPGRMAPATNGEILVRGVAMGIIISGITRASRSITGVLIKHPLALFSTGVLTGYLTHKYRKEIVTLASRTAVESKNVVLRQREHLSDFIAEINEENQERRH